MSEVLRLREELARLKVEKTRLSLAADAALRASREQSQGAGWRSIGDIDLETAAGHLAEAIRCQHALVEVNQKTRAIKRELGEE